MTNRYPLHTTDEYRSMRAAAFLNFAAHLRIDALTACDIASDAIDDDSNQFDPADAPLPTDARMILLALANELFSSDDDFDDFTHELDHTTDRCLDLIDALQHPHCCDCDECNID